MILQNKQTKEYGNECLIYKTVILYEHEDKYAVAILTNYIINWASDEPSCYIENFENLEQALEFYNGIY